MLLCTEKKKARKRVDRDEKMKAEETERTAQKYSDLIG
jgi:hypothetical protein